MCGIAGILGREVEQAELDRIAQAMVHRGPDDQGTWVGEQAGLAFRRLAIIDLDPRSSQPMHLGPSHLVFNGEIYNYLELRQELSSLGHSFLTEGDAEVLLHAWAQWGKDSLARLNGMFAFAVWDDERRELTLATDRFGEKPVLYTTKDDSLLFASDVRALRMADASLGVPDEQAVREFLAFGTMPTFPQTFFADVHRLPPSHVASWKPGEPLTLRRYWMPRPVEVPSTPAAVAERLRDLLTEAVRLRLRSDVPVGTSLSGGVDSSAVATVMSRLSGDQDRHAFTASFPGFERDEWRYAGEAGQAASIGVHHEIRPTADELLADLATLVADQEEPFGSTSIYAQWRVMRAARDAGVIVLLDGQGADELFCGYPGSFGWALRSLGARAALQAVRADRRLATPLAVAYFSEAAPRPLVRRYRLARSSPYVSRDLARTASGGVGLAQDWPGGGTPLRRELGREAFCTSLPHLCRFADRDSMAHSVEVRLPFLDPGVAEFALSLAPQLLFRDGVSKAALRDAVRGLVPDAILDRRDKVGYETPETDWFRTQPVRDRFAEILLDPASVASGRYDTAALQRDLAVGSWRDIAGVWRAVNVELWLRSASRAPVAAATAT